MIIDNGKNCTAETEGPGTAGDCRWTVAGDPENRTLVISGNGAMENYGYIGDGKCRFSPWYRCRNQITALTVEPGVTGIGNCAFYDCSGLSSILISDSVTGIGDMAFADCSGLTSILIPDSVKSIGAYAFAGCSGLTSILIPDSVTDIGAEAFSRCNRLTAINAGNAGTAYSSVDGTLFNKDRTTLVTCPAGKDGEYSIPDSVTDIGEYAFAGCRGLTSVTVPGSVTKIDGGAFEDCSGLTSITCLRAVPPDINKNVFTGVDTENCILRVPAGAADRYGKADGWKKFKNIAEI